MMMIMMLATASSIFAGTTGNFNIKVRVTYENVSIQIVDSALSFGYVVRDTSVTSVTSDKNTGLAVKNDGAVNIDLKARISANSFGWSTGTTLTDNGTDKFVLAMVFHTWDGLQVSTNPYSCFDNNDVLLETDKDATDATGSVFAAQFLNNQSVATPAANDGVNLAPGDQINAHFFFKAPSSLSDTSKYGEEQTITVTLTAVQR
jgi:hypothetical protein